MAPIFYTPRAKPLMDRECEKRGRRQRIRELRKDGDRETGNEIGRKKTTEGQEEIEMKNFQRPTDKEIKRESERDR